MADLKAIYMTEVEFHNGTSWTELKVEYDAFVESAKTGYIVLYSAETPQTAPSRMSVSVNFQELTMRGASERYTAFHDGSGGIGSTQKSIMIRYKLAIGTWTSEEIITVNQEYHYMMIKAGMPDDPFSGAGSTATVNQINANVALKLYFPAFTSSQLSSSALTHLKNLLQTKTNWVVFSVGPQGIPEFVTPGTITVGEPTASGSADYGLAKILVTLSVALTFPQSGTYDLVATFKSNDSDSTYQIPGGHTVTASILVNTGSTSPLIVSFDADATMSVSIASA